MPVEVHVPQLPFSVPAQVTSTATDNTAVLSTQLEKQKPAKQKTLADTIHTQTTKDLAECGTGRGGGAIFLRAYLDGHEVPGYLQEPGVMARSTTETFVSTAHSATPARQAISALDRRDSTAFDVR